MGQWEVHTYTDTRTGAKKHFYYDVVNEVSTWEMPDHCEMLTPAQCTKSTEVAPMLVIVKLPPPPPPQWEVHTHTDTRTGVKKHFYYDVVNEVSTWEMPAHCEMLTPAQCTKSKEVAAMLAEDPKVNIWCIVRS